MHLFTLCFTFVMDEFTQRISSLNHLAFINFKNLLTYIPFEFWKLEENYLFSIRTHRESIGCHHFDNVGHDFGNFFSWVDKIRFHVSRLHSLPMVSFHACRFAHKVESTFPSTMVSLRNQYSRTCLKQYCWDQGSVLN